MAPDAGSREVWRALVLYSATPQANTPEKLATLLAERSWRFRFGPAA
jgi:hypothetical protein